MPPPSTVTVARRPGQSRSTAASTRSTVADGICLNGPVKVEKQSLESELTELRARYVPRGITTAHPLVADRAKGSELWDVSGRRFVDFAGGIGVMNGGHRHPPVMEACRAPLEPANPPSRHVV